MKLEKSLKNGSSNDGTFNGFFDDFNFGRHWIKSFNPAKIDWQFSFRVQYFL